MWSELTREEIEHMLQLLWWEHAPRQLFVTQSWRQYISRRPTIAACDIACNGGYKAGCYGGCGLRDVRFVLRTTFTGVVRKVLKKKEVPDLPF